MNPIFPVYAALIRAVLFIALILILVKTVSVAKNRKHKAIWFVSIAVILCAFIYTSFIHGNIYKWRDSESDLSAEKILSFIEANATDENSFYREDSGNGNPAIYITEQSATTQMTEAIITGNCPKFFPEQIWESRCITIDSDRCRIIIEPAIGTRFISTPTGIFESDMHVITNDVYYKVHIVEDAGYAFLQPFMVTAPVNSRIMDILDKAQVFYESN